MGHNAEANEAYGREWHPIGTLYARRALDPVIDVVVAIADDFANCPAKYQRVPDPVADTLGHFRSLVGRDPDWPDAAQRVALSGGVIDGLGVPAAGVRKAAIVFVEQSSATTEPRLRRAAREATDTLRASCEQSEGAAMALAERQLGSLFERAASVLTSEEVTGAFGLEGLPAQPDGRSGLAPFLSPGMVALYEAVRRTTNGTRGRTPAEEQKLGTVQRIARHGADALSMAMDGHDDGRLDTALESAYNWARALQDLLVGIDVPRAWLDPRYLLSLQTAERDILPPSPAGEIELDTPALQAWAAAAPEMPYFRGTFTVSNEVCCSTACSCSSRTCSSGTCDQ
jgi:mersacidin/lichenicidin family type 2 lantibiotic